MSKKHFELVAEVLRQTHGCYVNDACAGASMARAVTKGIAYSFAVAFRKENPRFDRERFMKACGFEPIA